jgi:hypothetical protein
MEVYHLGYLEETPQCGYLDRDILVLERLADEVDLPVLPKEDSHISPGDRLFVVEPADLACQPSGFVDRAVKPRHLHVALSCIRSSLQRRDSSISTDFLLDAVGDIDDSTVTPAVDAEGQ